VRSLTFTAYGRPQPAGSKRAFPLRRKDGSIGVSVSDANPKAKDWQFDVQGAALRELVVLGMDGHMPVFNCPVVLDLRFYLARPKGHMGTGRNAEQVKASAPAYPVTKPDTTKLVRGVEDALTGILWRDDAQIVDQHAAKFYTTRDRERCEIAVSPLLVSVGAVESEAAAA
jgi:Holliday junction resolvase RusA-like endonuclease